MPYLRFGAFGQVLLQTIIRGKGRFFNDKPADSNKKIIGSAAFFILGENKAGFYDIDVLFYVCYNLVNN